jgi:hypothetical protein
MDKQIKIAVHTPDACVGVIRSTRSAVMNILASEGLRFEISMERPVAVVRILGPNPGSQPRLRPLQDTVPVVERR